MSPVASPAPAAPVTPAPCRHAPARPPLRTLWSTVAWLACALLPGGAFASADPGERQADAPRPAYRSAFSLYRPWHDQAVGDWRALNDRVGRIGGWRTYLREAHEAEPAGAPPADAPTPAGPRPGHGSHSRHGGHGGHDTRHGQGADPGAGHAPGQHAPARHHGPHGPRDGAPAAQPGSGR
jgi:hypothetical protein